MYLKFKYETLPLKDIELDPDNPRIVSPQKLRTPSKILEYLYEHEDLAGFIRKISVEGKNIGAERPYVVGQGNKFIVVEGNTRVAAYKVLTGQLTPPASYANTVPSISEAIKKTLETVDCTVAPNRDALLGIMASSHFGLGDKSKWGYLGSRRAVFEEWKAGRTVRQLANVFGQSPSKISDLIIEYKLYQEALALKWDKSEREKLLNPALEFNPPVRFLQTKGHKEKLGISYDKASLSIIFFDSNAKKKFKHLINKLVVSPQVGMGATATFDAVFKDYINGKKDNNENINTSNEKLFNSSPGGNNDASNSHDNGEDADSGGNPSPSQTSPAKKNPNALFSYDGNINDATLKQLLKEAKSLNCNRYPGAGTALLRSVVETVLKHIIYAQNANPKNNSLSLENSISICQGATVSLPADDKKVLKEFNRQHLNYLNLGVHGNSVPNFSRLMSARDCIDGFIKRQA